MFLGQFRHSVDNKGRVAVPAQFRRELAVGAVIAPGSEGRVVIWPTEAWEAYVQRFQMSAPTGPDMRLFMRQLYANSRPVELDAQGRLLLIPEHRRFAGIGDRAVFVGMGDCVELVGEEVWNEEASKLSPQLFTDLADRINRQGGTPPAPAQA